jgi:hypothetical protein
MDNRGNPSSIASAVGTLNSKGFGVAPVAVV